MYKKFSITLIMAWTLLSSTVAGVSPSYTAGDGGGSVSVGGDYSLGAASSLREETLMASGMIFQRLQARGTSESSLDQSISGPGYSIDSAISAFGSLELDATSTSAGAGAEVNHMVAGQGDIRAGLGGWQGSDAVAQAASVAGGVLSSSQSLLAGGGGGGMVSGQTTEMVGSSSRLASTALSQQNCMEVAGAAGRDGHLLAGLKSLSSGAAAIGGSVSLDGMTYIGQEDLGQISSQNIGMALRSLYAGTGGGIEEFDLTVLNTDSATYEKNLREAGESLDVSPGQQSYSVMGGSFSAYEHEGWKWKEQNPQVQLYLRDDANMMREGLDPAKVSAAVTSAANTWDAATSQNLFADGNTVIVDSTKNVDQRDGYSVIAWKDISSEAPSSLAFTRIWYLGNKENGYYPILETDLSFNTGFNWYTGGQEYDVEAVALHELGHTLGLDDLYDKSNHARDTDQIMHYYSGPRHSLGNGDRMGLWALYGQ